MYLKQLNGFFVRKLQNKFYRIQSSGLNIYPPTLHARRSITKQQNEFVAYWTRPCVASFARTPITIELTYVQGSVLDESQHLPTKLSKHAVRSTHNGTS